MRFLPSLVLYALAVAPALTDEARQLDAHEHGVGQIDIAFDGPQIAMELHASGADIVGFEHPAERAEDRSALDAAVAMLAQPLDLFLLPDAAGCSVVEAAAGLESDNATPSDGAGHSDFHAEYMLTCADPTAVTSITFAYFEAFPNAERAEVRVISDSGAALVEVRRETPTLDLRGMF